MNLNFSGLANFFPQPDTHIESFFELDGQEYEIEHFFIDVSQEIDHKGQPQHEVNGGMISIVLTQSIGDNIYDWAKRANKTKDGKILFKSKTAGTILEITFTNAYCIKLTRTIDAQTGTKTNLTISPEVINMNGFILNNKWRS